MSWKQALRNMHRMVSHITTFILELSFKWNLYVWIDMFHCMQKIVMEAKVKLLVYQKII